MSPLHVALLALSALALPTSSTFAQVIFGPGMGGVADRSNPGRVTDADVQTCQGAPGGSRVRANCDVETTTATFQTEQKLAILIKPPPLNVQCGATTTTQYQQMNTTAHVDGVLEIADCAAASGTFTVAVRTRDDNGQEKPLEFSETWQRTDAENVTFTADYPIGENVELLSVRLRGLTCTCADPPAEDLAVTGDEPATED